MKRLETLLHQVRETPYLLDQLRISASKQLVEEILLELEDENGYLPDTVRYDFEHNVFWFGPLLVHPDDDLPTGTFMIKLKSPK